jgi:hypothetical protein
MGHTVKRTVAPASHADNGTVSLNPGLRPMPAFGLAVLPNVADPGHFGTDPDLHDANKKPFLKFFCLLRFKVPVHVIYIIFQI